MALLIVEHTQDGTARYIIDNGADASAVCRRVAVVAEAIPQIATAGGWRAAHVGCLACGKGWAAVALASTNPKTLECLYCGAYNSAIVEPAWCSACGHDTLVVREAGAPLDGLECSGCHNMTAMVDAA